MKPITAWSYSRLSLFKLCPAKFKYQCIDKLPGDTWANTRGTELHKMAESFINGKITGMPIALGPFQKELVAVKKLGGKTELDLTVTKDWKPTCGTNWNNAWCRCYADVIIEDQDDVTYIDHKTGRIYDSHETQAKLSATCVLAHYPDVIAVDVEFWYYDQHEVKKWHYNRSELPKLKRHWAKEIKPLFSEKKFKATPSETACRWCPYSAKNKGPCKHGR